MLSKNRTRFINSLKLKKIRSQEHLFIVEGAKNVQELLASNYKIDSLYCTKSFYAINSILINKSIVPTIVESQQLIQAGTLSSNDSALAVVEMTEIEPIEIGSDEYILVLDDIRDPGNLGTIIRIADWYGIRKIIASETTVDFYNPKVVNATMGSFTRVRIQYGNLESTLNNVNRQVYGAFIDGENIHQKDFAKSGYLVIGNESNGIGETVSKLVTDRIAIPRYGKEIDSLNAAVATAVILDNILR